MRKWVVALGCSTLACGLVAVVPSGAAETPRAQEQVRQAFDMAALYSPAPVRVGDRTVLAHELHLTNFATRPLVVERVRVVDARTEAALLDLAGDALSAAVGHVAVAPDSKRTLPPGARAVLHLEALVGPGRAPGAVRHLVDYAVEEGPNPGRGSVRGGDVAVDRQALPVLSPPLRGGPWVAVYDPKMERGHRRVFYAVGGKARLPGRFAVDWMPAGPREGGKGDSGLGAEVLAVADGVVASTRDGVPEPAPGAPRPRVGMADATGNYVSIDIGGGRFAFYEHLMPGLAVKPGQRVKRGRVIGRLGSTGQVSRPHLHFHIASANSPLAAEGLPYLLSGARQIGAYGSIAAFEAGEPWQAAAPPAGAAAFPTPNAVVSFNVG